MEPIDVSYDGGYFDKDEQGWVADPIAVVQSGDDLLVQRAGRAEILGLGRRHPHAGFVELVPTERHSSWVLFDLVSGRLVGGRIPTARMLTRPAPLGLRDDPVGVLAPLVAACAAATRALYPASVVAPPGADALARLLAGTDPGPQLVVHADPGPGVTLVVWRDATTGTFTGCSARTSVEGGEPYAGISLRSSGELDLHVGAPTLERMDAAFAALSSP